MNDILSDQDIHAVQDILIEQLNVERAQLTPDARIEEDLGADSLDVMEIVMGVETHFHLTVPDERVEQVCTVGDLFETIADLIGNRRGHAAQV